MSTREVVKIDDDYYALVRRRQTRTGFVPLSRTIFNVNKDRGLAGKKRRLARKAAQRAERAS